MYRRRGQLARQWYEFSLAAAALSVVVNAIRSAGGYHALLLNESFSAAQTVLLGMWAGSRASWRYSSRTSSACRWESRLRSLSSTWSACAWRPGPWCGALRQYNSSEPIVQLLTAGLVILLFAYSFSNKVDANEAVGLLPLSAVLAARMLADRITISGLTLALAAFLAGNWTAPSYLGHPGAGFAQQRAAARNL